MATEATTVTDEKREVTVDRRSDSGRVIDTVVLDPAIFGLTPNVPLMHQVVTAQLAARRSGTQSTKTRAEVAGGASKPYRQKGTGRARQGTIRAPQFAGGGVALGPKPRSYAQRTPRKMVRLALHSALSDRASEGRIALVDQWSFEVPKTKDAVRALTALGADGSVLVVLGPEDSVAERSFANLPHVDLVEGAQLTAYDVLVSDWVVFTNQTIPGEITVVEGSTRPDEEPEEIEDSEEEGSAIQAGPEDAIEADPEDVEAAAEAESEPATEVVEPDSGETAIAAAAADIVDADIVDADIVDGDEAEDDDETETEEEGE